MAWESTLIGVGVPSAARFEEKEKIASPKMKKLAVTKKKTSLSAGIPKPHAAGGFHEGIAAGFRP